MHRRFLLEKLSQHSPIDEHEAAMLLDIIDFVNRYPNCFERELEVGHITGSAWIIDSDRSHALLTHHRKLDRWLQLGGHSDGQANTLEVALREGREESGLAELRPLLDGAIFDVDVHLIPARKQEPEHYHYDVRFLFEADRQAALTISDESHDLAWMPLDEIEAQSDDESILRMVRKSREQV